MARKTDLARPGLKKPMVEGGRGRGLETGDVAGTGVAEPMQDGGAQVSIAGSLGAHGHRSTKPRFQAIEAD